MIPLKTYQARRQQLAEQIGEQAIALVSASQALLRNGDAHYRFRQSSDFYYLTGFNEPNAVLLILGGKAGESILFNQAKHPEEELWTGERLGQEAAPAQLGVQAAHAIESLPTLFPTFAAGKQSLFYTMGQDALCESLILKTLSQLKAKARSNAQRPSMLQDLEPILSEMRLFKSVDEIKLMKKAADISVLAHQQAMRACLSCDHEYQLEAELLYTFTQQGCRGVAYDSIVAAGKNACILHYSANQAPLIPGELVLIDAAGEYENYAADITRTFPINGRFSGEQRALYELVLLAQQTAIRKIKPGLVWSALQDTLVRVLTEGLKDLGLLKGSVDTLIETEAYKRFYMHSSGHWLGLDVHDCGHYKQHNQWRKLAPNMVFTVEPGLYIPAHAPQVDPRWWNMGIRIEDDLLVTETGYQNLTEALPVSIQEIEAWMDQ